MHEAESVSTRQTEPHEGGPNLSIGVRMPPEEIQALDEWRRRLPGVPGRPEAIRTILREYFARRSDPLEGASHGRRSSANLTVIISRDDYNRLEEYMRRDARRSYSEALRVMVSMGLDEYFVTGSRTKRAEPPLLLPPPAPEPAAAPTLSDLAALIRKTAETNPFVRPLADFIDGRI